MKRELTSRVVLIVVATFLLLWNSDATADEPSTLFHGKVLFQGMPMKGVTVHGRSSLPKKAKSREGDVSVKTDEAGRYEIRLFGEQQFTPLLMESENKDLMGFVPIDQMANRKDQPLNTIGLLDVELAPPQFIRVQVVDPMDRPIEDANVYLESLYKIIDQQKTDRNGIAKIKYPQGMPNQTLGAMKAQAGLDYRNFEMNATQNTHPENLPFGFSGETKLCLNGIREVSIKILDPDGKPLPGIEFRPWLMKKPNRGDYWNLPGIKEFLRVSDQDGVARFDMLAIDQEFGVDFWPSIEREDWFVLGNGKDIRDHRAQIKWNEEADVTVHVRRHIKIQGRVLHQDGSPAKGIGITAHGSFHYADWFNNRTTSGDDGRWEMWVKPDGYYLIVARSKEFAAKPYDGVFVLENQLPPSFDFVLEPARRIFGRVKGELEPNTYIMLQQYAKEYHNRPDQLLNNPNKSKRSISSFSQESQPVRPDGTFEFHVGPGEYIIWDPLRKTQKFILQENDQEKYFEFVMQKTSGPIKIKVAHFESDKPAENFSVIGKLESLMGRDLESTTNARGEIDTRRTLGRMHVLALNQDQSIGGFALLEPDQEELEILVQPTATVRGVLHDKDGEPIGDASLQYGIEVKSKEGLMSNITTSKIKTDKEGRFELKGIVLGTIHKLSRVIGDGTSYEHLTDVISVESKLDLGTVVSKN